MGERAETKTGRRNQTEDGNRPTMSEDDDRGQFDFSRRKLLGSVATLGAAGAIGGAGTMAFFSDTEEFANNQLTAGELDLKVDWEEHYSNWMGDEVGLAEMPDDPDDADYVLPAFDLAGFDDFVSGGASGEIGPLADGIDMEPLDGMPIALSWTEGNTQDDFWNATSIDAFPDDNGDGVQDAPEGFDICEYDADLDGVLDDPLRTPEYQGEPLINLNDVKPGDFGEVTFSFHLCDNPGYVWLTGDLVDADENGNTEPEAADEDEYGPGEGPQGDLFENEGDEVPEPSTDPADTEQERVELLDYILTRIWYDDGNNQVDEITGELDVVCCIDTSGSLGPTEIGNLETGVNAFIDELDGSGADVRVGSLQFGDGVVGSVNGLTSPGPDISLPADGDGNTPMPGALDIANQLINDAGAGARAGAEKVIVVFTDGGPNYSGSAVYNASTYSAGPFPGGNGGGDVTVDEMDETLGVADGIKSGGVDIATVYVGDDGEDQQAMSGPAITKYGNLPTYLATGELGVPGDNGVASTGADAFDVDVGNLQVLAGQLVDLITTAETVFFLGTLRDALTALSMGPGFPLEGDIPAEDGGGTGRNCFSNSNDHYIGFEWWLPINHGNQVQGDSVSFDIGFYTEQCRHNDGSGMANS